MQSKSVLLFGILGGLIQFLLLSQAFAQQWEGWLPICVRQPNNITKQNAAIIKGEDCRISSTQAALNGQSGNLSLYTFRDGNTIKIFNGECSNRPGPCQVQISINKGEWVSGVFQLPNDLIHDCGKYSCNWYTYKSSSGRIILGIGMSY
jgi:hypothetical protein